MLLQELAARGQVALHYRLIDGQRRLPSGVATSAAQQHATLIAVDGYEQLGPLARWRLSGYCRYNGRGLLVTSHDKTGLPTLWTTRTSPELALRLAAHLWGESLPQAAIEHVNDRFIRRRGDLREVLFDLYDFYESQRPSRPAAGHDAAHPS